MSSGETPASAPRRRAAALAGHTGDADAARALLDDADPAVRATAYAALDRLGALDGALLLRALSDAHPDVRRRAATLAARTTAGAEVADALLELLGDDESLVAEAAAWALGEWEADNPRLDDTIAALRTMTTSHEEPLCREAAVAALGAIGDARGLDAILIACSDKPAVRRRAVLALAPFEGDAVEAAIDRALTDRDWQVRQAAEDLRR
ncbi:MAG TPA: HEAT repeat domain-containing protein [Acidimicrobiales bacterium]|nr:HEAT repeat domain-containing protein [Acidimicrobiales bacterium]